MASKSRIHDENINSNTWLNTSDEHEYLVTTRTSRQESQRTGTRFPVLPSLGDVSCSKTCFLVFLTVATVISNVAMVLTLPLYSQSLENKSNPYYLLFSSSLIFAFFFFALLLITKAFDRSVSLRLRAPLKYVLAAGCLNALNGLMVVYASDPSRTSPTLQAILGTSIIPFTVIARYVIIRQGVGWKRLACTGVVLVGLFISMEPVIFNIDNEGSSLGDKKKLSTAERVLWPIIFLVGFLPLAVMNVLLEKVMKEEVSSLLVNVWVNIFQLIVVTLLFWTDFIPHFGVSSKPDGFWSSFKNGFGCQYGTDSSCSAVIGRSWLFVVSYAAANIFNFLLLRHSDGAIYLVVVQALVTPLGAIFWTLFMTKPYFHWQPQFDLATGFTVAGLIIMMPAVTVYHYLGKRGATTESLGVN